jgi:hypothetical protein
MKTFTYTTFAIQSDKHYADFIKLPKMEQIEADGILEADAEFERRHGINPRRHKGHTPPISVSIQGR